MPDDGLSLADDTSTFLGTRMEVRMRHGYFSRQQQSVIMDALNSEKWSKTDSQIRHDSHLYATPDGESVVLVTSVAALDFVGGQFEDMLDLGPVAEWVASFQATDSKAPEFPVILDRRWATALLDGNVPPDVLEAGRLAAEAVATPLHSPSPGTSP